MILRWNWRERARASAIHLGISLAVAFLAALLVFGLWYPYPYRVLSGGRELFQILITVDAIMGPLITLMIFDRAKPWRELRRDLAIVGLLQLAALAYGLWTVFLARPVHLVFEFDRLRAVHAVEVPPELLDKAPRGIDPLPVLGPTLLAVRPFRDANEKMEATLAALNGVSLGSRPDLWQSYDAARERVREAARPASELKARFPRAAGEIDAVLAAQGRRAEDMRYLPLLSRRTAWTAFIEPASGDPVAYMPLDSF